MESSQMGKKNLYTNQQGANEGSNNCVICSLGQKLKWNNNHHQQNQEHELWQSLQAWNVLEKNVTTIVMHGSLATITLKDL